MTTWRHIATRNRTTLVRPELAGSYRADSKNTVRSRRVVVVLTSETLAAFEPGHERRNGLDVPSARVFVRITERRLKARRGKRIKTCQGYPARPPQVLDLIEYSRDPSLLVERRERNERASNDPIRDGWVACSGRLTHQRIDEGSASDPVEQVAPLQLPVGPQHTKSGGANRAIEARPDHCDGVQVRPNGRNQHIADAQELSGSAGCGVPT